MENPKNLRPKHSGQCVVLITDDEAMVRNVARVVLEREGYFILTADNGEEALYIAERYPGPIHLLLTDIRMPEISGLELRERFVRQRQDAKVILMSAEAPWPAVDVPFLQKPFGPQELREKIENVIDTPCKKIRMRQFVK